MRNRDLTIQIPNSSSRMGSGSVADGGDSRADSRGVGNCGVGSCGAGSCGAGSWQSGPNDGPHHPCHAGSVGHRLRSVRVENMWQPRLSDRLSKNVSWQTPLQQIEQDSNPAGRVVGSPHQTLSASSAPNWFERSESSYWETA